MAQGRLTLTARHQDALKVTVGRLHKLMQDLLANILEYLCTSELCAFEPDAEALPDSVPEVNPEEPKQKKAKSSAEE